MTLSAYHNPRILVCVGHFLPGCKGGGPIRSIANLVEVLGSAFRFFILTADRDLGDQTPYSSVIPNIWQTVGKAQVLYLSPDQMNLKAWAKQLQQIEYDLAYLNSFFGLQTRYTLILRRLGKIPRRPVVLAPRGEFSSGALGLKSLKKRGYIQVAMRLGLYDDLIWHATSDAEIADIQKALGAFIPELALRTILASNLTALPLISSVPSQRNIKQANTARILFFSRIARKKNLDFALTMLQDLEQPISFDIYGTMEDLKYWRECERLIQKLPSNIKVAYRGGITPEQVPQVLSGYHLFFLPTRGENFGHAIVEALGAGCPVLISDQTPWRDLAERGIGWDIPLTEPEQFRQALRQIIVMDQTEFAIWSVRASKFAADLVQQQTETELQAYQRLFAVAEYR